jgi:hypothetical protein
MGIRRGQEQTLSSTFCLLSGGRQDILVLTGGFDKHCQEVRGEGADVEEDAGRLGGAEAEVDLLLGQVRDQVLLVCRILRPAARVSGTDCGHLEVVPQPHALFKKRTHICWKGKTKLKSEERFDPILAIFCRWVDC